VYAVGDRAIEQTLNALARAQREFPRGGIRHRIEHCAICPPDLRDRVRIQHIVPAMKPAFFWEFGEGYLQNYGRHRADTMFPVKSLIAARVPVAGSSDAPVRHYAPLFGIEQGLARRPIVGDVCGSDEHVDLPTAIRMHTINGAFASFEEGFKGSLEVGKVADLVLLGGPQPGADRAPSRCRHGDDGGRR
jgi:predicted amidohydrolase YtcJ